VAKLGEPVTSPKTDMVLGLGRSHGRSIGFTKRDDQYRVIVRIGLKKEHQSRPGFISGAEWNAQEFVGSHWRRPSSWINGPARLTAFANSLSPVRCSGLWLDLLSGVRDRGADQSQVSEFSKVFVKSA
jgi:hypothetical protein